MNAVKTKKVFEDAVASGSAFYLDFVNKTESAYAAMGDNDRPLESMFSWAAYLAIYASFEYRFPQIAHLASLQPEDNVDLNAISFTTLEDGADKILCMHKVNIRCIADWPELVNLRNLRNLLTHSFGRVKFDHKHYSSLRNYISKQSGIRLDLDMYIVMNPSFIVHVTEVLKSGLLSTIGLLPNLQKRQ